MIGELRARETGAFKRGQKSAIFCKKLKVYKRPVGGGEHSRIHFPKNAPNGWALKFWSTFFAKNQMDSSEKKGVSTGIFRTFFCVFCYGARQKIDFFFLRLLPSEKSEKKAIFATWPLRKMRKNGYFLGSKKGLFWSFLVKKGPFLVIFGHFWLFFGTFRHFGHFWAFLGIFGHFWAFFDRGGCTPPTTPPIPIFATDFC